MPTTDRVLIIEEETLLALDIEYVLAERGPVEVTHYRGLADAPPLAELPVFDIAFIEGRLGASEVVAFTEGLVAVGIPTVVMSADRRSLERFPHAGALEKPFDAAALLAACEAARTRVTPAPRISAEMRNRGHLR